MRLSEFWKLLEFGIIQALTRVAELIYRYLCQDRTLNIARVNQLTQPYIPRKLI